MNFSEYFKCIIIFNKLIFKLYFSQNGVVTNCISSDTLDTTILANTMSPNRDIQSSTNGLAIPHSPKSVVPDICVNIGHKFSNLLPMLGYCEQCSVRVFVGMFYKILNTIIIYLF